MYSLQESQFPIAFSALLGTSPTGFQRQMLRSLIFSVQVPLTGEPGVMLRALTPQEDLHSSDNPPVCEWLHQGYGCWPDCTSISLACLIVSFPSSYPLLWTVFSISVQLILKGDHSMRTVLCLVAQSYPTLCDPTDCSPPGSSVHGILQARILEWVAFHFSRASSQPRD